MPGVPPNALSLMKSKFKGILSRKKNTTPTTAEPTKTEEPLAKPADTAATTEAAVPTEVAAAEAATDPVAAASGETTETTTAAAAEPATTEFVPETKTLEPVAAREADPELATAEAPVKTAERSTEETPAPAAPSAVPIA